MLTPVTEWHEKRIEAAARALAELDGRTEAGEEDRRRAQAATRAADGAGGGIVPRVEFEQLALDSSARRVEARQTSELLQVALETLEAIVERAESEAGPIRDLAFATAVELRTALDAREGVEED